jgi:DNA gyrase inhibitor GyrI
MKQEVIAFIPATEVFYMRRVGQYGAENYALMERMKLWAAERGLLTEDAVIYAIALDNPQSVEPEKCRYDVCLQTTEADSIMADDQVSRRTLSGGKYAIFKIEHTAKAVADFWTSFPTDMAKSEYKMDFSRPIMERYSVAMVKHGCCEMCVPILY